MTSLNLIIDTAPIHAPVGLIDLDLDPTASHVTFIDRTIMRRILSISLGGVSNIKVVVPINFTITSDIMIIMHSDTLQYNAVVVDGVKAELINLDSLVV